MPLLRRMNRLKELFHCRVGPGAAVLPRDVTRIHLLFAKRINNGHFGPRIFWHDYLPRLKYHNPAVNMTIERVENQESPATMTIFYGSRGAKDNAAQPAEMEAAGEAGGPKSSKVRGDNADERMKTVNMQHRKEDEIYKEMVEITGAKIVQHTPEELAQLQEYKRLNEEKAVDSVAKKAVAAKQKAERMLEEQARAAASAAT